MTAPALIDLRACLEGGFPALIATCASDGTPNVSALSDVRYIDEQHIALSFQFFNKTRANILTNPHARLQLTDPRDGARYMLTIRYLRTETSGPLFAAMRAKLAGIASHSGMSKVFVLRGADVYAVEHIEQTSGALAAQRGPSRLLAGVRAAFAQFAVLGDRADLTTWIDITMHALSRSLGFEHGLLLLADQARTRLYTVASHGYTSSGVGSEIAYGEGVIGAAAEQRTAIRLTHMAQEYQYGDAVRAAFMARNPELKLETRIPLPGLDASGSQMAVPVLAAGALLAVLYVESPRDGDIDHDDEDACLLLADACARAYLAFADTEAQDADDTTVGTAHPTVSGAAMTVSHDADDHSVFIDDEYLIKGVAGAILWRMLRDYVEHGRVEFNNKDLRRDRGLGLPEVVDNLEARLVLLQRRLRERLPELALEKSGRGRYQLRVARPLRLTTDGPATRV